MDKKLLLVVFPVVFTANIFSGVMLKVRLDNGKVVGSIDTGFKVPKRSFGGVAEFTG